MRTLEKSEAGILDLSRLACASEAASVRKHSCSNTPQQPASVSTAAASRKHSSAANTMDALVKQCEAAGEAVKAAKAGGDAADIKAKVAALVKISA